MRRCTRPFATAFFKSLSAFAEITDPGRWTVDVAIVRRAGEGGGGRRSGACFEGRVLVVVFEVVALKLFGSLGGTGSWNLIFKLIQQLARIKQIFGESNLQRWFLHVKHVLHLEIRELANNG